MRQERLVFLRKLGAERPTVRDPAAPTPRRKPRPGIGRPAHVFEQGEAIRVRVGYTKLGRAAFSSHLDLVRLLPRIFRRLDLPLHYSQGFHPNEMTFGALSLSVANLGSGQTSAAARATGPALRAAHRCLAEGHLLRGARIGPNDPSVSRVIAEALRRRHSETEPTPRPSPRGSPPGPAAELKVRRDIEASAVDRHRPCCAACGSAFGGRRQLARADVGRWSPSRCASRSSRPQRKAQEALTPCSTSTRCPPASSAPRSSRTPSTASRSPPTSISFAGPGRVSSYRDLLRSLVARAAGAANGQLARTGPLARVREAFGQLRHRHAKIDDASIGAAGARTVGVTQSMVRCDAAGIRVDASFADGRPFVATVIPQGGTSRAHQGGRIEPRRLRGSHAATWSPIAGAIARDLYGPVLGRDASPPEPAGFVDREEATASARTPRPGRAQAGKGPLPWSTCRSPDHHRTGALQWRQAARPPQKARMKRVSSCDTREVPVIV
jgi:hypothetical protein